MKKLNFLLSLSIIATLLFASCSKEESVNVVEPAGNLVSITATTPNAIDTKAYLEEADGKVVTKWHEGDQISVYDAELGSHAFTLKNGAATTSGTFEGAATKELKAAAFPYSEESVYGFESGTLEGFIMPGTYGPDVELGEVNHVAIPMFATVGENNNFQFKALGGFIQVRCQNVPAEAKYLHFTVKDGFISGKYNLRNLNTDNFTSERTSTENSGDNEVTIALPKADKDGIVTINIPVLGATYSLKTFKMELLDADWESVANTLIETKDDFSHQVKAGTIVRLPVVDLEKLTPEVIYYQDWDDNGHVSGTGCKGVEFSMSEKIDIRNTGKSDFHSNNIFFGNEKVPYYKIEKISLPSETNYSLTFTSNCKNEILDVLISNDGFKWVKLSYAKAKGGWNYNNIVFSLKNQTDKLYIGFKANIKSQCRVDEVKLETSTKTGTEIDFSKGDDFDSKPLSLEVFSDAKEIVAEGTNASFEIKTNGSWTVSTTDEGISNIKPNEGDGDATVSFDVLANESTTEDKTYTFTISAKKGNETIEEEITFTHLKKGEEPVVEEDYSSNVTWNTDAKNNCSYSEKATVNGEADVKILKLGKGSEAGKAELVLPDGTYGLVLYGCAWGSGKDTKIVVKNGEEVLVEFTVKPNEGANKNSPYTINGITKADKYTIDFGKNLGEGLTVTIETIGTSKATYRALLFGIQAQTSK